MSWLNATFINRRTGQTYESKTVSSNGGEVLPGALSYTTNMQQLAGAFELEILFDRTDRPDLRSHDFVEFWFDLNGTRHQVGVGFMEKFNKKQTSSGLMVQANGRELIGQMISLPFKIQQRYDNYLLTRFVDKICMGEGVYLTEYLKFRNRSDAAVDRGSYRWPMLFVTSAESNRGGVIQEYAELSIACVFQDRLGRVCIYGRNAMDDLRIPQVLRDFGDPESGEFTIVEDYSKVFSEATVMVPNEGNVDLPNVFSPCFKNSDPRVKHIYQPLYKTLAIADLISLGGQQDVKSRQEALAKSLIRKSNQNIDNVVVQMTKPFYTTATGEKIPYEMGQNWGLYSDFWGIDTEMKLAGLSYNQQPNALDVQLSFLGKDTLV